MTSAQLVPAAAAVAKLEWALVGWLGIVVAATIIRVTWQRCPARCPRVATDANTFFHPPFDCPVLACKRGFAEACNNKHGGHITGGPTKLLSSTSRTRSAFELERHLCAYLREACLCFRVA